MIPNHQQLLGLLERMEPTFLAGSFATDFEANPEADGERGSFLYFEGGYWDIAIDGTARFQLAPGGSRVTHEGRTPEDGPGMERLPMRPPWSLVLPRWSAFLGRADDDWQLNASVPVVEEGGSWRASLTSLVKPEFTGPSLSTPNSTSSPGPTWGTWSRHSWSTAPSPPKLTWRRWRQSRPR